MQFGTWDREILALLNLAWERAHLSNKFFTPKHMSENDLERARSIDSGVTNKFY